MPAPTDIGMTPPPPPETIGQMRPGAGGGGGDIGSLLAGLLGPGAGGASPPAADIGAEVFQLDPILTDLAKQVPALAPDISALMGRLKERMGPMMPPGPGIAPGPMGGPAPMGAGMAPGTGAPPPIPGAPGATPMPAMPPAAGPLSPPPPPDMGAPGVPSQGALQLAMQVEMILPAIGAKDPTLAPDIQFFVAKMRDEVAKTVEGQRSPGSTAPTETMLSQIPVTG